MKTANLRIIKRGNIFEIQKPITNWWGKPTGQWETLSNPDWAAVYGNLEDAKRQIRFWNGEDTSKEFVVEWNPKDRP